MKKFCMPDATLVGGDDWLPEEPFDHAAGFVAVAVGCNNIRCGACGEKVAHARDTSSLHRRYWCRCQSFSVAGTHVVRADYGKAVNEFVTEWRCDGHPTLTLPARLEGVEVPASGPDAATIERLLRAPPFSPPGKVRPGFWVARLYVLVDAVAVKETIGAAVARGLWSTDPMVVAAALGVFFTVPGAHGADQITRAAAERGDFFRATDDPLEPDVPLEERLYDTLQLRVWRGPDGAVGDPAALAHLEERLLAGENPAEIVFAVGGADPAWLAQHAAALVDSGAVRIASIVINLKQLPAPALVAALRPIAARSPAEAASVKQALERYVADEATRAQVIAAL